MGVKFADRALESAFNFEMDEYGNKIAKLGSAKKTGAGIGGLLGAIALPLIGAALAPFTAGTSLAFMAPLLTSSVAMGAIGGGVGAFTGGKVAEKGTGIDQDDLIEGRFGGDTRQTGVEELAKDEFSSVGKGVITGGISGYKAADAVGQFGTTAHAEGGGLLDAIKEYGSTQFAAKFGSEKTQDIVANKNMANQALSDIPAFSGGEVGGIPDVTDIVSQIEQQKPVTSLLSMGTSGAGAVAAGSSFEQTLGSLENPQSKNDVKTNLMDQWGINTPELDEDAGQWVTLDDGREYNIVTQQFR